MTVIVAPDATNTQAAHLSADIQTALSAALVTAGLPATAIEVNLSADSRLFFRAVGGNITSMRMTTTGQVQIGGTELELNVKILSQGPGVLVKYLRARDAAAPIVDGGGMLRTLPVVEQPLPDRYTHHCHLCGVLLERYSRPQLETAIRSFYDDHPWRLIISPRGLMPFMAEVAPA